MKPAPVPLAPFRLGEQPDWGSQAGVAWWRWSGAVAEAWLAAAADGDTIRERAQRRLKELVSFARSRSPYYGRLYAHGEWERPVLSRLPIATRQELMAHFDEWVTDPEVTRASIERFVADLDNVGHAYLGRYAIWKSSGTTGEPGLFVHDGAALAVYDALDAARLGSGLFSPASASGLILMGARYAMLGATGGHYAGVASIERLRLLSPALSPSLRVFSLFEPLPQLVEAMNRWQPSFLATHPSAANALADAQRAGALKIRPAALWLGGENLSVAQRTNIGRVFRCPVLEQYGASECMSIACECARGSLHLNADWVMLEPVDRYYRPVPPGVMSHSVLITNLANRVQPIIRYDLGDSVLIEAGPCPCGSPLPVLRIEGRTDEVVRVRAANGRTVELLPVALTTLVEQCVDAHPFQIVQGASDALSLRIESSGSAEDVALWQRVARALRTWLDSQDLSNVAIEPDTRPIAVNARSGKMQRVLALH
jgi:phenylacetate-coenzyme A ligase PaaK-like adenylate-forming protein